MGIFDAMKAAKTRDQGDYFPADDANYVVEVAIVKWKDAAKVGGAKKPAALIVEFDVLECPQHPERVGKRFSEYYAEDSLYFEADGRTLAIRLMGFVGVTGEAWADQNVGQFWEEAIDPIKQPLQGLKLRVATWPKETKEKKNIITGKKFEPWYASHEDALAAMKANANKARLPAVPAPGAPPPPPPPPVAAHPQAGWTRDPSGAWALNPRTNQYEAAIA